MYSMCHVKKLVEFQNKFNLLNDSLEVYVNELRKNQENGKELIFIENVLSNLETFLERVNE